MSRSLTVTCLVKLWLKMLLCPLLFSVVAACRLRVRPAARVRCGGRRAASAALGLPAHKEGKISPRPLRGTGSFPGLTPLALSSLSGSAVRSVLLSIHPQRVVVHHARPRQYGCVRPDGPTHPKPTVPDHENAFPEEGEGAGGCPTLFCRGRNWGSLLLPAAGEDSAIGLLALVAWARPVLWKRRRGGLVAGRGELARGRGGRSGSRSLPGRGCREPTNGLQRGSPGCHLQPRAGPTLTPSSQEGCWDAGLPAPSSGLGGVRTPT